MYATPAGTGVFNLRVSIQQRYPGEARNAMAAILGSSGEVKNVFVVDDDIDVFSDDQMEWALATRFQRWLQRRMWHLFFGQARHRLRIVHAALPPGQAPAGRAQRLPQVAAPIVATNDAVLMIEPFPCSCM